MPKVVNGLIKLYSSVSYFQFQIFSRFRINNVQKCVWSLTFYVVV